jgi:uncharacterized MAPEG superfamily protein
MTVELFWMILTVFMTALFWLPYLIDRIAVRGLWAAVSGTQAEVNLPHSPWAQRAVRAHQNAVENLAIFVPAVLTAHVLNISTPLTRMAAVAYFAARLLHYIVYTAGVPLGRTLCFTVGWVAQMVIIASVLHWL